MSAGVACFQISFLDFHTATDNLVRYLVLVASRKDSKVAVLNNLGNIQALNLFFATVRLHICTVQQISVGCFRFFHGQRTQRKHVLSSLCIKAVPRYLVLVSQTGNIVDCTLAVCFSDCLCNPCTGSFGREIVLCVEAVIIFPCELRTLKESVPLCVVFLCFHVDFKQFNQGIGCLWRIRYV